MTTRFYKFQKTELQANMNRWYIYEVTEDPPGYSPGTGWVHVLGKYGRVGDRGNVKDYGVMTSSQLAQMMFEREHRKNYKPVDLVAVTADGSGAVVAAPPSPIVALIFAEANETISNYLASGVTVDQLSQAQIVKARALLDFFDNFASTGPPSKESVVRDYYNTIPTKLPRKIDPQEVIDAFDPSVEEVRLQQLEAAISTLAVTNTGASQLTALGAEIEALDSHSLQYRSLLDYVKKDSSQRITVDGIYEVAIPTERAAYNADQRGKSNRKLLFHGTKNANVRHIMKSGLIVPRHAANGRSFGDGIYFADKSGKAQNYCGASGYSSAAPWMILVSEVSLGKVYERQGAHHYTQPPAGYDSVMGVPYGGYQYNEIVVYSTTQQSVRFLVTFHR